MMKSRYSLLLQGLTNVCSYLSFLVSVCFPSGICCSLYSIVLWDIGKLGGRSFGDLVKFKSDLVLGRGKPLSSFGHDIIF